MDIIYLSAVVTLVAQASDDGNAGIPGIGSKQLREPQGIEYIQGKKLLCTFPSQTRELRATKYFSSLDTSEEVLSPAKSYLGHHQPTWSCWHSKSETMYHSLVKELSLDPNDAINQGRPEREILVFSDGGGHVRFELPPSRHISTTNMLTELELMRTVIFAKYSNIFWSNTPTGK